MEFASILVDNPTTEMELEGDEFALLRINLQSFLTADGEYRTKFLQEFSWASCVAQ